MTKLNVNPTRMELQKLKSRLRVATKGHKLLKDKSDEMIRQFMALHGQNQALRDNVEEQISSSLKSFILARAIMTSQEIKGALCMPTDIISLNTSTSNIMGLQVPKISLIQTTTSRPFSNSHLFKAADILQQQAGNIFRLAEIEKKCHMLANEIQRNRRRINSLEFILIPQLQETIKYITMKLDERERQNITRLMKVKQLYSHE